MQTMPNEPDTLVAVRRDQNNHATAKYALDAIFGLPLGF
jgi:hypothetical protein